MKLIRCSDGKEVFVRRESTAATVVFYLACALIGAVPMALLGAFDVLKGPACERALQDEQYHEETIKAWKLSSDSWRSLHEGKEREVNECKGELFICNDKLAQCEETNP